MGFLLVSIGIALVLSVFAGVQLSRRLSATPAAWAVRTGWALVPMLALLAGMYLADEIAAIALLLLLPAAVAWAAGSALAFLIAPVRRS